MTKRHPITRRHIAIHEAGHAVIGRVVTMLCGGASIVADEDSAGHSITADPYAVMMKWEEREKWRGPASVWRGHIICTAAGAEAENEIMGDHLGGDGDDRYQIALMLGAIADEGDHDRLESRLRRFARQLVRKHRADIEKVADALEGHGTLTADEIDALLPPTFMSRPVTWALALADAADDESPESLAPQR